MPQIVVKSKQSRTPVAVRFINKSFRTINILWIDFSGDFIPYKTLFHNQFVDINTYTNHPWLFADSKTGDFMKVRNKDVFYPKPILCPRTGTPGRMRVEIYFPLYTLRTNALLTVRNLIQNSVNINSLELPLELKRDLQISFENQSKTRYTLVEDVQ